MKKYYVGKRDGRSFVFACEFTPTQQTHGMKYNAVVGPFRTKRAAILLAVTGGNNPHIQHVNDAERIAASN